MKYDFVTKKIKDGYTLVKCEGYKDCDKYTRCITCPIYIEAWNRLFELEDKIRNGVLVELQCK